MRTFDDVRWNRGTTTLPSPPELKAITALLAPDYVVVSERRRIGERASDGVISGLRVLRIIAVSAEDDLYLPLEVN